MAFLLTTEEDEDADTLEETDPGMGTLGGLGEGTLQFLEYGFVVTCE